MTNHLLLYQKITLLSLSSMTKVKREEGEQLILLSCMRQPPIYSSYAPQSMQRCLMLCAALNLPPQLAKRRQSLCNHFMPPMQAIYAIHFHTLARDLHTHTHRHTHRHIGRQRDTLKGKHSSMSRLQIVITQCNQSCLIRFGNKMPPHTQG